MSPSFRSPYLVETGLKLKDSPLDAPLIHGALLHSPNIPFKMLNIVKWLNPFCVYLNLKSRGFCGHSSFPVNIPAPHWLGIILLSR